MRMDVNFVLPLKNEREVFPFTNSIIFLGGGGAARARNFVSESMSKELQIRDYSHIKLSSNYLLSATALTSIAFDVKIHKLDLLIICNHSADNYLCR